MYVNIGGDVIIDSCKIIGIFDIDKTTVYKVNRNYLSNSEKRGNKNLSIFCFLDHIRLSFIVKLAHNIVQKYHRRFTNAFGKYIRFGKFERKSD